MAILILCIDSIFPIFGRENNHKYFVYIYCPGWLFYMTVTYITSEDYMDIVGEHIPFKKLGHPSFESFIVSIPDVVSITR